MQKVPVLSQAHRIQVCVVHATCWALEGSPLVRMSSPQLPGNPPSLVERWPASCPEPWLPGAPKTTWMAWVTDLIRGPVTCVGPASCVLRHPADASPSGHRLPIRFLLAEILFPRLPGMRSQHMHVATVDTVTRTGRSLLPDQPPGCRVMGLSSATSSCNDDSALRQETFPCCTWEGRCAGYIF